MNDAAHELDGELHRRVEQLCEAGDALARDGAYREAIVQYNEAWVLIPSPKTDWHASTWVLAAIGDACFLGGFNTSAREAFDFVMHCPEAIGNPFLHLRRGQVLLDAGEDDAAAHELVRAYSLADAAIFENEDPRYLEFLRTRAEL